MFSKALLLFALAPLAFAHYTFPSLIVNGTTTAEWEYVRITENHYSQGPLEDVTSDSIRCYELDDTSAASAGIATVSAGSNVGFKASNTMGHPGYFSAYLSTAVPSADSESAGLGSTWFKIWEWSPSYAADTGLVFDSENIQEFNFTIPAGVPSGQYLLRAEQIALHIANAPQFYIACAQLNVVGGGSGSPGPTVAFPGAYSATDPGIDINIYSLPAGYSGYEAPGPAVWSG
ncbi:lytic polysaccharide monooxygenase [Cylindrobasidium torrendii FP15055 ss-10]|uniref:lytic cellulose monooxygenase (C4-dehydrogenating) n=1 Tax=Cylindrobasidium torrendii FP15055 ss-10 TaxID=1314674 RepID=A0A0D7BVP5_9AGAR|nr:lytic polysaccharide monooxygenase [Cylindrobasidium torrendii FP15055 ss-10]